MIRINGTRIEPNYFPDGTLKLNCDIHSDNTEIEWNFENNEEMVIIYFLTKHLRENFEIKELNLYMSYIPNGRMDRTKNSNEVFTLKYFCEFINNLNFNKVIVRDPHSNVSTALLNNVIKEDISWVIRSVASQLLKSKDVVFFPDEGSCKRYSEMINEPYLFGIKKRDWKTGEIKGLNVFGEIPSSPFNVLIIDDISSYGTTFLKSAEKLKELGANKIYLYVTHCENSILDGKIVGSGLIDKIYTTDSIFTKKHPLIEIIHI